MIYVSSKQVIPLKGITALQLKAIKEIIDQYFQYRESRYEYTRRGNHTIPKTLHFFGLCKSLIEKNSSFSNYCLILSYDVDNEDIKLTFRFACEKPFVQNNARYISDTLPFLITQVELTLNQIIKLVLMSPITRRRCRTFFLLRYMDFSGTYTIGDLVVYFGQKVGDFNSGKVILFEFPYEVICIMKNELVDSPSINNAFESLEQYKQLLQFLIRAPLEECDIESVNLDDVDNVYSLVKGKEYNEKMNINSIYSYTSFERNHLGLPAELSVVCKLFDSLSPIMQCEFIHSCSMYAKALVASASNAITNLVIVLENLGKYLYHEIKGSHNRFDMIFEEYCGPSSQAEDYKTRFYAVRCLFAHEAVTSQNQFQRVLNEFYAIKSDVLYLEKVVYLAMIDWIRRIANESE